MTQPNTNPYAAGAPAPGGGGAPSTPPATAPAAPPQGAPATVPATPPATAPAAPAAPVSPPPVAPADALSLETPAAPTPEVEPVEYTYASTGDSAYDLGLNFAGKHGYGPDSPEMQAAMAGDFSKLEAALKDKGGAPYIAAAKEAMARRAEADQATVNAVYTAVGGQENWSAIQALFREKSDSAEKAYINQAFKLGGQVAIDVAKNMHAAWLANGGGGPATPTGLKEGAGGGESVPTAKLTTQEFTAEVSKLVSKYGAHGYQARPEFKALVARRG